MNRRVTPIRWFRGITPLVPRLAESEVAREFLSSGTTSHDGRSRSKFSTQGVATYEASARKDFRKVLSAMLGARADEVTGISLVPNVATWPDSSLAQMIAWLSKDVPIKWCSDEPVALASALSQLPAEQPIFIFGTAFHFVNLADHKRSFALPANSFVIETGGTKGKSRSVTRVELYREIANMFSIRARDICSEYGMAELASQAWDFVPRDHDVSAAGENSEQDFAKHVHGRRFRFLGETRAMVCSELDTVQSAGTGILVIEDRARVDLPDDGRFIQTEDLGTVDADGSFQLLGRVPNAPLKGCSTLVPLNERAVLSDRETASQRSDLVSRSEKILVNHAITAKVLADFLGGPVAAELLSREIGSHAAARSLLRELKDVLPLDDSAWKSAIDTAVAGCSADSWLLIGPSSHSLATLQPLILGIMAGFKITVRDARLRPGAESFTQALVAELHDADQISREQLQIVGPEFRVGRDAVSSGSGLLAFGSDETLRELAEIHRGPLSGFGTSVAIAVLDGASVIRESDVDALTKDAFSLGQQGCMSVRLVVILAPEQESFQRRVEELARMMPQAFRRYWDSALDVGARGAIILDAQNRRENGWTVYPSSEGPFLHVPPTSIINAAHRSDLNPLLAHTPFTLVAVHLSDSETLQAFAHRTKSLHLWTAPKASPLLAMLRKIRESVKHHVELREPGSAQQEPWTGRHSGRSWFADNRSEFTT